DRSRRALPARAERRRCTGGADRGRRGRARPWLLDAQPDGGCDGARPERASPSCHRRERSPRASYRAAALITSRSAARLGSTNISQTTILSPTTPTRRDLFARVLDPTNRANPYPLYAELRRAPVSVQSDGSYVVSTYAEIAQLLHDPRISSDER